MKISVDFDSTLTRKEVQDFVLQMIKNGAEVFCVTSRFYNNEANIELYELTDELGIHRIIFTDGEDKVHHIPASTNFHLDDDMHELRMIKKHSDITPVYSHQSCEAIRNQLELSILRKIK